jgi:hypothetical protein
VTPDVINVVGFGCSETLLRIVSECGGSQLIMNRDQYEFIQQSMVELPNGRWVKKTS